MFEVHYYCNIRNLIVGSYHGTQVVFRVTELSSVKYV
jgi:hypothetical protein